MLPLAALLVTCILAGLDKIKPESITFIMGMVLGSKMMKTSEGSHSDPPR